MSDNNKVVRVRFAPSPTGYVHIGSLRTALYNYLFAKHHGGVNILRIEDTDQTRYVDGAVENLLDTMQWAGISFDEGPIYQSKRTEIYQKYSKELVENNHAYYCFCTPERLSQVRKEQQESKIAPMYDRLCRNLSVEEVKIKLEQGLPHVIRLRVPINSAIEFTDIIRKTVKFECNTIDDQVLLKSDGFPTYHLANVIDDHLMDITHVIRGEEWLPSTPKHILLYNAFGWTPPQFAHLPLLLNDDGSKMSKRSGDVAVENYKIKGFLPEALINFVTLLGWNPSPTQEIFSMQEFIELFNLANVKQAGAIFDIQKLTWMNSEYIKKSTNEYLLNLIRPLIEERGYKNVADDYILDVINIMKPRVHTLVDFVDFANYFFINPKEFDQGYREKYWNNIVKEHFQNNIIPNLHSIQQWNQDNIEHVVRSVAEQKSISAGKLIHPLRLAVTGRSNGPSLFGLFQILGKNECMNRLENFINTN